MVHGAHQGHLRVVGPFPDRGQQPSHPAWRRAGHPAQLGGAAAASCKNTRPISMPIKCFSLFYCFVVARAPGDGAKEVIALPDGHRAQARLEARNKNIDGISWPLWRGVIIVVIAAAALLVVVTDRARARQAMGPDPLPVAQVVLVLARRTKLVSGQVLSGRAVAAHAGVRAAAERASDGLGDIGALVCPRHMAVPLLRGLICLSLAMMLLGLHSQALSLWAFMRGSSGTLIGLPNQNHFRPALKTQKRFHHSPLPVKDSDWESQSPTAHTDKKSVFY